MAKKKVVRKSAAKRGAAKTAAKKSAKKAAKKPARKTAARKAVKPAAPSIVSRESAPYAIHLDFLKYSDFARGMTSGNPKHYLDGNKNQIEQYIHNELLNLDAHVLTECNQPPRRFEKSDQIKVEIDHGGRKEYRIAVPAFICEDANGNVDLDYLRQYIYEIRNTAHSVDDCAYALLGMYFLSRCR